MQKLFPPLIRRDKHEKTYLRLMLDKNYQSMLYLQAYRFNHKPRTYKTLHKFHNIWTGATLTYAENGRLRM